MHPGPQIFSSKLGIGPGSDFLGRGGVEVVRTRCPIPGGSQDRQEGVPEVVLDPGSWEEVVTSRKLRSLSADQSLAIHRFRVSTATVATPPRLQESTRGPPPGREDSWDCPGTGPRGGGELLPGG